MSAFDFCCVGIHGGKKRSDTLHWEGVGESGYMGGGRDERWSLDRYTSWCVDRVMGIVSHKMSIDVGIGFDIDVRSYLSVPDASTR